MIGFTRGFLFAGARAVVSSLWQVDDAATARLMQSFYSKLQTMSPREALRQAQLEFSRNGASHPFYWAAFQITGAAD